MSHTNITNPATLQTEALRGLSFYKEEIKILDERLMEAACKNNSFEARQQIEHFQNQFMLQQKNINGLRHRINEYLQQMGEDMMLHEGHIEKRLLEKDLSLTEQYKNLEKLIRELRDEFNKFLVKWK